jgi:isoleucyl-tRNA synthetase
MSLLKLTLASEDSKYGVHLQGEPDNERLGKWLKGDFKKVAPAIKALTSEQLTTFQESGEITVEGHTLSLEDIKVSKYEAIVCMRCFIVIKTWGWCVKNSSE